MNRFRRAVLFVPLAILSLAAAFATFTLPQGEDLLIQRQYKAAAQALEGALPTVPEGQKDRVLLLLGEAQLLAGDPVTAIVTLTRLLSEQPGSGLAPAARFLLARAHETNGDKRHAAEVYRAEIERLTGFGRKDEVAAVYLGLAEKAAQQDPPDHARVVAFCDLAVDLGLEDKRALAIKLMAAEAALAQQQFADAIARLQPLVDKLDPTQGKLRAMLALGQARRQNGDAPGARAVLRDLQALAGDAPQVGGDAAYEIALSFGVPQPAAGQLDRAVAALAELRQRYPAHKQARIAPFLAAQCFANNGRGDAALQQLDLFLAAERDAGIDEVAMARAMKGDVLAAQGKFEAAIAAWREYLGRHPAHAAWERVQRGIVDAEWRLAVDAFTAGKDEFGRARERLAAFARSYPLDERNPDVLFLLGDMLRQEQKYDEAREAFARCVSKYPGKDQSSRAQFAIGEIYEQKTFDHAQALQAYRAVTWGVMAAPAQRRIAALTQKHLHLCTDRIFRSDEQPVFVLTSRNIESVRVRVFRLDLEDYFRATHRSGDVQNLDIEVIAPDQTFDSPVPDYVRYRETERKVELPFRAPGAYVVKVDDKELEATTLVLVSDLALIAKSSRHEFFVFTQNTVENRAAAGVRVVLSDGQKIVAEGVTGPDGVYRFRGDELKNRDDLRVLAIDQSGSGACSLDLSGMGYSAGLVPKGYLFSDRPLYQPGQRVFLKGIVREVKDGLYALPAADGYRVQVVSPSGRPTAQRDVKFTAFGTFATELDLPAAAETGKWRVVVDRPGRAELTFASEFEVAVYQRPRLSLHFELQEPVVFRGEPIRGRLLANWFYGEPAGGREVAVRMTQPDGAVIERRGTTNAAGEFAIELPTTEFAEEAMAQLAAEMPGEGVATQLLVPVVTTEFQPVLQVKRNVYLAGEPFEVTVKLFDPSGKPLQKQATATLLRLEQGRGGIVVETEVEHQEIATGADGIARATFAAARGGDHRVRVTAKDRFGTLVSGDAQVRISAADDEVRLRLLCDRETFRVGETASVKVVNRAGAHLALLTWQGDGVLAYETRMLQDGEQTLELPLRAEHAPNFALAFAMVDGNKLHTAEREFKVDRDLQLALEVPATAKPGSEVEVLVHSRDPQGKPVAAEVAIALVDEALLALRGDGAPPIGAFFYGTPRETAFRTRSSCTWSYQGKSQLVNAALLAEEVRRAMQAQHAAGEAVVMDEVVDQSAGVPASQPEGTTAFFAVGLGDGPSGGIGGKIAGHGQRRDGKVRLGFDLGAGGWDDNAITAVRRFAGIEESELPGVFCSDGSTMDIRARTSNGFLGGTTATALPSNEPRVDFRETGAWLSAVVTDQDGNAKVAIKLPDSTTGWRVVARAVTADTWVGEQRASVRTQKPLQVDYEGPRSLTEGDTTAFGVRAHNLGGDARTAHLSLRRTFGPEQATEQSDVELPAHGEAVVTFPFTAAAAQPLELELRGEAGDATDALRTAVPVQPFGIEVTAARAGQTTDRAAFELSLPEGREFSALRMFVELGPDPARDLLRAALGQGFVLHNCRQVENTTLAASSRGLAAITVLDYLGRGGEAQKLDRERLDGLVASVLQGLVQAQLDDGSYAWAGKVQDLRSTCQGLRFLAACRRRGLPTAEAPLNKAAEALLQALRNAAGDQRADILWALAEAGRARFESLNSLHRARAGLSTDAIARLALAWLAAGRQELAAELQQPLQQALAGTGAGRMTQEAAALAARALLAIDARDATATAVVERLRADRIGAGWQTPEATAAALAVLTMVQGGNAGAPRATEIAVEINGKRLATTPASAQGLESVFAVPTEWLRERGNAVAIAVQGGGQAFFSVSLLGAQRGFRDEDRNDALVRIDRRYLAAPPRHGDRQMPTGFGVVTGSHIKTFENEITQLAVGQSGRVRTSFWVRREEDRARMTPLVLEEPLPAGCSVPRSSISGSFDAVEVEPDRLVFYFREGVTSATVEYELQARFGGNYRAGPSHVYSALRPEFSAYGAVGAMAVLPRGQATTDAYRQTPDELFAIGKAEFDAAGAATGDERARHLAAAYDHLSRLASEWQQKDWRLRDDVFKEVARMMLTLGIERGDARLVVRYFEELKDRYADLVVPFAEIVAVGRAYFDLGEFESALLVFRATAEASFLKDAGVVTTLENLGERKAGTAFLEKLLTTYPDLPTMRVSRYSIGQKLAELAARTNPTQPVDERMGSVAELRQQALLQFREFLVRYPEDPLAEEVSFAWTTTLLEGKDLERALQVADAALQRYHDSPFEDEQLYSQGYAHFALGHHEQAFAALERVATGRFADGHGGTAESESKWHAIYLQGQIWHAQGQPEKALAAYDRVQDRFSDAGEAIDYFRRQLLSLPEVTTFALGAQPELELEHRNVAKVAVQVFQVDLMRLYLLERSLNDIRGIQLHGIKPLLAFDVELGSGRDYATATKKLPLQLPGAGAYLCVVRGGDHTATGMVLQSDLRIEAQERFDEGLMRVNVKTGDAFVADAHVKIVGSGGGDFQSGETDLRGVFAANALVGQATVIVKKGDQYAFFRGTGVHRPDVYRPALPAVQQLEVDKEQQEKRKDARSFDALEQNYRYNAGNRSRQVLWLQEQVLNKQQRGVEVYKTK